MLRGKCMAKFANFGRHTSLFLGQSKGDLNQTLALSGLWSVTFASGDTSFMLLHLLAIALVGGTIAVPCACFVCTSLLEEARNPAIASFTDDHLKPPRGVAR